MKKILILLVIISNVISAKAENLFEIAKIKINTAELSSNLKYYATEFYTSSKKKISKNYCFDVYEIIESHIKQLTESERKRLIIIAESDKGETVVSTIFDYDKNYAKIPPLLIYKKVTIKPGDTIRIKDKKGVKGMVDINELQDAVMLAVQRKIYLQMPNISASMLSKTFEDSSIVFPQDQTTVRWLGKISYIKLYMLK